MNARLVSLPSAGQTSSQKDALIASLRGLLLTSFRLQNEGARTERLAEARALADGFMRALSETGLFSDRELITIVQEARRGVSGPSTAVVSSDEFSRAV